MFAGRASFDRNRLTGEHGLIEQDFSLNETHIRSNDATE
jgi:hypothetical protein